VIGAVAQRHPGLGLGGDDSDHDGAPPLRELDEQATHTARRGVDQGHVVRAEGVGAVAEVVRRQAVLERCGGEREVEGVGDRHEPFRGHDGVLGVHPGHPEVGHPVPHRHARGAVAQRGYLARRLDAGDERESDRERRAGPVLSVHEVDADGTVADQDLAKARHRIGDVHRSEHVRAPELVHANRTHRRTSHRESGRTSS